MKNNYFKSRMKGQSAIEYLTTYGWMLLVIAIVGGAIFSTVQSNSSLQQTSGFTEEDVEITNFGTSANGLSMEIRAQTVEQVTVNGILMRGINASQQQVDYYESFNSNNIIPAGGTNSFVMGGIQESDNSNEFDVEIYYDTGNLENISAGGTLTDNIVINQTG